MTESTRKRSLRLGAARPVWRWVVFLFVSVVLASVGRLFVDHELTLQGRLVCPPGLWRSSPGVCAFAPVSIALAALGHLVITGMVVAAAVLLVPKRRLATSLALLALAALGPAWRLIVGPFSWVALASLCGVAAWAGVFLLGVAVGFSRDSTDSAPTRR